MAKIIHFSCLDSTHKQAIRMIEQSSCSDGDVIVADMQTAGVGRYDRKWESVRGNVFLSILKNTRCDNVGQLSLTVACAVHDVLNQFVHEKERLQLHWPNDVFFSGKKLCGVLISVIDDWIVISIGINIVPVGAIDRAISLQEIVENKVVDTTDIVRLLVDKVLVWLQLLTEKGFSSVKQYWLEHAFGLAEDIEINNSSQIVRGIFRAIDDKGSAMVETTDGIVYVTSGDFQLGGFNR